MKIFSMNMEQKTDLTRMKLQSIPRSLLSGPSNDKSELHYPSG